MHWPNIRQRHQRSAEQFSVQSVALHLAGPVSAQCFSRQAALYDQCFLQWSLALSIHDCQIIVLNKAIKVPCSRLSCYDVQMASRAILDNFRPEVVQ
jgi:hypothetical protein